MPRLVERIARGVASLESPASRSCPEKQKTAHAGDGDAASDLSALDPSVFATDVVANAAAMYAAASPYPHGVVSPLCADASLRAVQAEMREHLTATFKETDLFKVLQTGDLVTIDRANPELVPKIPNLLRLARRFTPLSSARWCSA